MFTITVPKAAKILDRPEIPDTEPATIIIDGPIPDKGSLEAHQDYFQGEADKIYLALKHLPQGIVWRLMIRLMERQSNELLGSYKGKEL